jgi:hypothetical protein
MSPDNEYFWIEPEEVRALAPLARKREGRPAQVTEPWLAPSAKAGSATLVAPSPVPVMEASSTPAAEFPAAPQNHANALEMGASSFQARTPDERLEEFVEWLANRYAGASVLVLSGARQVVTSRQAAPELLWEVADSLAAVLGDAVPAHVPGAEEIRAQRLVPITRNLDNGVRASFLPLFCEPTGEVLCLVIAGAEEPGIPAAEADSVQRIFAQLVEAMARG